MSNIRLQSELDRLYRALPSSSGSASADAPDTARAMVLELTRPPSWELLSRVWRGVQAELELPAPAIAVSGTDGIQLWFSLAEPVAAPRAVAFLQGLQQRFLADVAPPRIRLLLAPDASARQPERHAREVPALQPQTDNWSAFVAPDLAPVFGDTPWLDIPPSEEGQAGLLGSIATVSPAAFEAAMATMATMDAPQPSAQTPPAGSPALQLSEQAPSGPTAQGPAPSPQGVVAGAGAPAASQEHPAPRSAVAEAEHFLLRVIHDDAITMALRIEAAKALLQRSAPHLS